MIVKINILNYLNQLSSCWQLLYCQCLFMAGTSSSCTGLSFNMFIEFLQIYKIYLSMVLAAVWNGDASADVRHSSVELHHHPCPQQTKVPSSSWSSSCSLSSSASPAPSSSSSSNFQHEESDKHSLALNGCLRPSNNRITRSLVIIVVVIIVMGDNYCHNLSIFLVDILNFLYLDVFYLSKCLDSHFHQTRGHPVLSFTPPLIEEVFYGR